VRENGPLLVETGGRFTHRCGAKEETQDQELIALCRCGASANKPFCDGNHKAASFEGPGGEIELGS
ncbi:MAG: CDGSH iron-sulfur domain-containing protein, partial [Planctomycetota bacterium]